MRQKSYAPQEPSSIPLPGPIAFLGLGRAGRALAHECCAAGLPIGLLWDRTKKPLSKELTEASQCVLFQDHLPTATDLARCSVVFIAVRDQGISSFSQEIQPPEGSILLHLSGALSSRVLPRPKGGARGSYHPLQSFPASGSLYSNLPPYFVAIEGDPDAQQCSRAIAELTGHPTLALAESQKGAYHASAVLASNLLVVLQAAACEAIELAGISRQEAWPALRPLVLGTLSNLDRASPQAAITGPIARGDAETVAANLKAIERLSSAPRIYRQLGRAAVDLLRSDGGALEDSTATALARVLEVLEQEA